jgi:hypothetical protein
MRPTFPRVAGCHNGDVEELHEALEGSIPDKAARLIAEVFPPAKDLVTKSYVDQKFAEMESRILRWMLGLFVPVWAVTMGTLIVALQKIH